MEYSTRPHLRSTALGLMECSTRPHLRSTALVPISSPPQGEQPQALSQEYSTSPHLLTSPWSTALGLISGLQHWPLPPHGARLQASSQEYSTGPRLIIEHGTAHILLRSHVNLAPPQHAAPAHSSSPLLPPHYLRPLLPSSALTPLCFFHSRLNTVAPSSPTPLQTLLSSHNNLPLLQSSQPLLFTAFGRSTSPPLPPHFLCLALPSTALHPPLLSYNASASHIRKAPQNFLSCWQHKLYGDLVGLGGHNPLHLRRTHAQGADSAP